jgi:hypothetical protein
MNNSLTRVFVTSDFDVYIIEKMYCHEDTEMRIAYISFDDNKPFIKKDIEKYGTSLWISDNSLGFGWIQENIL